MSDNHKSQSKLVTIKKSDLATPENIEEMVPRTIRGNSPPKPKKVPELPEVQTYLGPRVSITRQPDSIVKTKPLDTSYGTIGFGDYIIEIYLIALFLVFLGVMLIASTSQINIVSGLALAIGLLMLLGGLVQTQYPVPVKTIKLNPMPYLWGDKEQAITEQDIGSCIWAWIDRLNPTDWEWYRAEPLPLESGTSLGHALYLTHKQTNHTVYIHRYSIASSTYWDIEFDYTNYALQELVADLYQRCYTVKHQVKMIENLEKTAKDQFIQDVNNHHAKRKVD